MVLAPIVLVDALQRLRLPRQLERLSARRHSTVGDDHHRVQGEPDQQQRHPGDPEVHAGEDQQEQVGHSEHAHPHKEVGAVRGVGERDRLERQPDGRQPPVTQVQAFEAA
jgi:hypothetical protein